MSNENNKIYLTNNGGLEAVLNEEDNTRTVTVEHPSIIVHVDGSKYQFEDIGGFEYDITRSKTGTIKSSIIESLNAEVEEGADDWLTQYTSTFEGPTEYRLQDGLTMIVPLTKENLLGIQQVIDSANTQSCSYAARRVVDAVEVENARSEDKWLSFFHDTYDIKTEDLVTDLGENDGFSVYFLGSDTPSSESTGLLDHIKSYVPDSAQKILLGSIVAGGLAMGAIGLYSSSQNSVHENTVTVPVETAVEEYTTCDEARTAYGQAVSLEEKMRLKPVYNRLCND